MFNWLRSLFAPPPPPPAGQSARFCPALECLGDRVVPAAGAIAEFVRNSDAAEAVTNLLRLGQSAETSKPAATADTQLAQIVVTVPESAREEAREARTEAENRLSDAPFSGSVVVRLAETIRSASIDTKWVTVQRLWLEVRAFSTPIVPGHLLAAPPLHEVHLTGATSEVRGPHSPMPVFHPHAADVPVVAPPKGLFEFWSIAVPDGEEPAPRSPDLSEPATVPLAAPEFSGASQPVPNLGQEQKAQAVPISLDGAGIITRFLPFDTADLRKGVSDFLCGLESTIPAVPEQPLGEWELGAALVVGTGVVTAVGRWGTRASEDKRRKSAASVFESMPTRVQ